MTARIGMMPEMRPTVFHARQHQKKPQKSVERQIAHASVGMEKKESVAGDYRLSFRALPGVNLTVLLAGILIS